VRSVHGFAQAFPALEIPAPRGCRSFKEPWELSGLERLTKLDLGGTGVRDLAGLTALRELRISSCPALTDLDHLGTLPALNRVDVRHCAELTDVTGLAGSPVQRVSSFAVPKPGSLRALDRCPGLRDLEVKNYPQTQDVPVGPLDSLALGNLEWADLENPAGWHELRVLKFGFMDKLRDISLLSTMPALEVIDLGAACRRNLAAVMKAFDTVVSGAGTLHRIREVT
jgi:hypothetical protein